MSYEFDSDKRMVRKFRYGEWREYPTGDDDDVYWLPTTGPIAGKAWYLKDDCPGLFRELDGASSDLRILPHLKIDLGGRIFFKLTNLSPPDMEEDEEYMVRADKPVLRYYMLDGFSAETYYTPDADAIFRALWKSEAKQRTWYRCIRLYTDDKK